MGFTSAGALAGALASSICLNASFMAATTAERIIMWRTIADIALLMIMLTSDSIVFYPFGWYLVGLSQ
jgi:hypothetical protein